MSYFPFFMDIGRKPCLVVGGGVVALRKIEKLLPFGADITVVSPVFCAELERMEGIHLIRRKFEVEDIEGMLFVIGATDDERVNAEISNLCREKNIPVNIVDDPEKCSFFFPALAKKGDCVVGISTGGKSPLAAKYLRREVEKIIPEDFDKVLETMAEVRRKVRNHPKREHILREVFVLLLEKNGTITEEELEQIIRKEGEHE